MSLISVIIPYFKKKEFIFNCINSILKQTYKNFEIIIVNDECSDGSRLILKEIANKDSRIRVINNKNNLGPGLSRNVGIKKSKGKYIFLLDGDDLFLKDKITYILNNKNIKKNLITDNFLLKKNNLVKIVSKKNYKKNYIFKKFFNSWPDKIITSTISLPRKLIEDFFKNNKTFLWKFLAIDVQLIIYYSLRNNFRKTEKVLTIKNEHEKNLDKKFSNILSKVYWKRRLEQHQYYYSLTKKKSIEYYICFYINFFLNLVNDINKRYI